MTSLFMPLQRDIGRRLRGKSTASEEMTRNRRDVYFIVLINIFIVALCYKMASVGALMLLLMSAGIYWYKFNLSKIRLPYYLGILYIADATVTSFLVSSSSGFERTAQFLIIAIGLTGANCYALSIDWQRVKKIQKWLLITSALIWFHVIVFHFVIGRMSAWKYLFDTKMIFSLSVFLIFSMEDYFWTYRKYYLAFLPFFFWLIYMSSELKAVLLFLALASVSKIDLRIKIATLLLPALFLALAPVLMSGSGQRLINKTLSLNSESPDISQRYFLSVHNIADNSVLIRSFVNRNCIRLFHENPILGLGANGYRAWAMSTYGSNSGLAMNVHGEAYRVPVEGGVVGIVIALAFLAELTRRAAIFYVMRPPHERNSVKYRAPAYFIVYLLIFAYTEAIDTGMMVLIGAAGIIMSSLPQQESFFKRRLRRPELLRGPGLLRDGPRLRNGSSSKAARDAL